MKQHATRTKRLAGILKNAALAGVSLFVTVAVLDIVAYTLLDIKPPGYRNDRFLEFSAQFGQIHKPNVEGYLYRYLDGTKFLVRTNRWGFADSEREIAKKRPRIALIGDSTTEFWEADEEDRGQVVIEKLLDHQYEVLNFGVRGYGTDQTYLLFENVGVRFSPNIVVYMFCINDIADNVDKKSKPYFLPDPNDPDSLVLHGFPAEFTPSEKRSSFLYQYSYTYRHVQNLRNILHLGQRLRKLRGGEGRFQKPHFELAPYKRDYDEGDTWRMNITADLISMLNAYVRKNNMKFLVVEGIYRPVTEPSKQRRVIDAYGDIFDFDKVTKILEATCTENGIPFLSLRSLSQERGIPCSELMHESDNMHLDGRGIRFFSEAVVEKLRALRWLDGA